MPEVLSGLINPVLSDFNSPRGTPLYVNRATGRGSVLSSTDSIVPLNGSVVNVLDFNGIDPTGTNDSTAALQAAFLAGPCVEIPPGTYIVTSTLLLSNVAGKLIRGLGGVGEPVTTPVILKWGGGVSGTLLKLTGVRDSEFRNFQIIVGAGTLETGIDIDPTGRLQAETNNTFEHIHVMQQSGGTTQDGTLQYGFRVSRATSAGNVENFTFNNIVTIGAAQAGISIEHAQSKSHVINRFGGVYCGRAISTALNSSTGGAFSLYGADMGHNTVADIELGPSTGPVNIDGFISEQSNRFLQTASGTANSSGTLTVKGGILDGSDGLAANGQAIVLGTAGTGAWAGPVNLIGLDFYGAESGGTAKDGKIGYNQNAGVLNVLGCSFNSITPFVNNGGTTRINSIGNRGWNGAAFVHFTSGLDIVG